MGIGEPGKAPQCTCCRGRAARLAVNRIAGSRPVGSGRGDGIGAETNEARHTRPDVGMDETSVAPHDVL
ncbi:hypothetical protein, partial [Burkholderia pseudomallei]|uniref:hypothetical protein n=1 Tax=Burkholderia pseudomallei TaxID=28450 RepID=UPI00195536F7